MSAEPLSVECPKCGSSIGERCSTHPNRIRYWQWTRPHAARIRAAERAERKEEERG